MDGNLAPATHGTAKDSRMCRWWHQSRASGWNPRRRKCCGRGSTHTLDRTETTGLRAQSRPNSDPRSRQQVDTVTLGSLGLWAHSSSKCSSSQRSMSMRRSERRPAAAKKRPVQSCARVQGSARSQGLGFIQGSGPSPAADQTYRPHRGGGTSPQGTPLSL